MIELGLSRISRLLQPSSLSSWQAIHIAGTNGKGSISSYLSHLLSTGGIRCGRFTSPHLIDRWDCITIDELQVPESLFRQIEDNVKSRDRELGIGATEFELLTASAVEIFHHERVQVGVVEVGVGGRLDATNILNNVLVSVIAKIGVDHQSLLGSSIEDIAREKGGILRPGVPCVIDGTNCAEVRQVLEARIRELSLDATADAVFVSPDSTVKRYPQLSRVFERLDLEPHQRTNMCCAVTTLQLALRKLHPEVSVEALIPHLCDVKWPGRLQCLVIAPLTDRKEPVLLDGAHNPQSAQVLAAYVDRKLRSAQNNVTWVIAASQGKNLAELFYPLLKPGDRVAATSFGPVDGMPWVNAADPAELTACVQSIEGICEVKNFGTDLVAGLDWAGRMAQGGPLVVAGSLYLASDLLRILRRGYNR